MGDRERVPLLRPASDRASYAGLPTRRSEARFGDVALSSGGGSWNRRINECLSSPSGLSALSSSLDSVAINSRRRGRSDKINIAASPLTSPLDAGERRPYHYRSQSNSGEGRPQVGQLEADPVEEAHYRRYQYYTRLQNQTGMNLDLLNIPDHVVPENFYTIHLPGIPMAGRQSSIVTIFSLWNTMLGTSLLSMPWALQQAGLVMGMFLMCATAGICLYTAYLVLKVYSVLSRTTKISEFCDLCGLVLGRWAEFFASIFSVLAILGAAIVYWVLMSNFLYSTVVYFRDLYIGVNFTDTGVYCPSNKTEEDLEAFYWVDNRSKLFMKSSLVSSSEVWTFDDIWGQYSTVPLFLILFLFPLVNLRSATFFTQFNSLGTISILFILSSVLYRCYEWGLHADFSDETNEDFIPLFQTSFPSLTGILALGLFIHNAIITIMSNNRKPENNGRDMSIAYFLVAATYFTVGVSFYLSFPLPKSCIEDNLLNNFMKHDALNVAAKIFLFFQLATVFPLIMYLLRISVFYPIFRDVWPGLKYVLLLNVMIVTICVVFAIFMPKIGTIIRYSGAACGMSMIFTLPVLVHLVSNKRAGVLTWRSVLLHSVIIALGAANFVAQFFI